MNDDLFEMLKKILNDKEKEEKPDKTHELFEFCVKRDKDLLSIMDDISKEILVADITGTKLSGHSASEIYNNKDLRQVFISYMLSSSQILKAKCEMLLRQDKILFEYIKEELGVKESLKQAEDILKEDSDAETTDK